MRHGHSEANQLGIIVSHPDNGRIQYGLSELGRRQVMASLQQPGKLDANTVILTSDFKRARETAEMVAAGLKCHQCVHEELLLRERNFGQLELQTDNRYEAVWQRDEANADNHVDSVESANEVMGRVTTVITECERRYLEATLVLVSHGDALQILQTAFAKLDASTHRSLDHLETAEIRQLKLAQYDP